jgi:hypothetical protein
MIMLPLVKYKPERHGPPKVLEAKLEKMALRTWLCIEDVLEVVERRNLDGFAEKT